MATKYHDDIDSTAYSIQERRDDKWNADDVIENIKDEFATIMKIIFIQQHGNRNKSDGAQT